MISSIKFFFAIVSIILSFQVFANDNDTTGLIIKDARGLGISKSSIINATKTKSEDFLVVFAYAESDEYVDLVSEVVADHFIGGRTKLYVLFYDQPEGFESGLTVLYYKGKSSLPVTHRADKYGADLSYLIGRVYQDHYSKL